MQRLFLSLMPVLLLVNGLAATAYTQTEQIRREAFQILKRHCMECHGPYKQESGLRLDGGSESMSQFIDTRQPEQSELLRRILQPAGHSERMPPTGPGLDSTEIASLKKWIQQGAGWPLSQDVPQHWAYVVPQQPEVPLLGTNQQPQSLSSWSVSPLDAFVIQKLTALGLQPAPRERPEKLVRRLYLDLIGLPPPPEISQNFAAQPTEEKYRQIVESLLAHPSFGERWGRVWLDAAHYADSHGYQRDDLREIWPYRDWVIQAFNKDMPFDQFTIEQLAGDLLPNATEQQKIATGFLRCTPTNVEAGSLPEETRVEQIFDRVNTVGTIWLGTTLECAQCHDHKYDPFSMKDYYQVFACFNNTELEADLSDPKVPSSIKFLGPYLELHNPAIERQRTELQMALAELRDALKAKRKQIEQQIPSWYESLQAQANAASESHILDIQHFESEGTTDSHRVLDDGSLLLSGGDPPDKDTYDILASRPLKNIFAIRLEALKHPSLPGQGPGRGDPVKSNFVLNEFSAEVVEYPPSTSNVAKAAGTSQPINFVDATADYSQPKYPVKHAIDGKPQTGWAIAPQFDRDHHAIFLLAEPLDLNDNQALRIKIRQQFGGSRTLGRFKLIAITGDPTLSQFPAEIKELLALPLDQLTETERKQISSFYEKSDPEVLDLKARLNQLETKVSNLTSTRTLVAKELLTPRPSFQFIRGDYRQRGDPVLPGIPALFQPESKPLANFNRLNRLTFAQWLVSLDNPLASRATVNRWWGELFGTGLVATPEDLGLKGALPSHPEMLDWLTVYYNEHDRSLKQLLRLIVLSETYRQSSVTTETDLLTDPENRWLGRGPRFRLDAEAIRDSLLSISGQLCLKPSGPPIYPQQPDGLWTKIGGEVYNYETSPAAEANRRSIYIVWKRSAPYPSMVNFDASSRLVCTVQRSRTNTPLQALTLLNDPVYVNAAEKFADRILRETEGNPWDTQLEHAFWLALSRAPSHSERARMRQLFEAALADSPSPSNSLSPVHRAWFDVATVLLNLHETITKE